MVTGDLMSRARAGDGEAFRELTEPYVATRWGLDHVIDGMSLEDLAGQPFGWQPGWEYRLP